MPDRVAAHLLGADDPDAALTDVLADVTPTRARSPTTWRPAAIAGARAGRRRRLVYLRDHGRRTGAAVAAAALAAAGLRRRRRSTCAGWRRRPAPEELVRVAGREALLRGCGLVAGPVEA